MDSTFSGSTPMDDGALSDLLGGITSDAAAVLTGTDAPQSSETPPMSAAPDVPPAGIAPSDVAGTAIPHAAPSPDDQSSVPDAPSDTPTTPPWDSPENPYRDQAAQYQQFIQGLHQRAQANQQQADMEARQRILEAIPDMEPEKARFATAQLLAWERAQAEQEKQTLVAQYEPYAKEAAANRLASKFSLTAAEIAEINQFEDPRMMAWSAEKLSTTRKAREQESKDLREQVETLTLRMQAQERIASPTDRVLGSGGNAGSGSEDPQSLDDLVAGLGITSWGSR